MYSLVVQNISVDEFKSMLNESISNAFSNQKYKPEFVPESDLIKIGEVSKLLSVSKVTIHAWKKQGLLPFHRISNKIYFKKSEVLEALKKINSEK